jgi:acetolactate synthase-1/3 small subunit
VSALDKAVLLELTVRNHPSVLARLTALCSRRAYTLQGLCCLPAPEGAQRSVWVLVCANCALEQVVRQLLKLEDVFAVRSHGRESPMLVKLRSSVARMED